MAYDCAACIIVFDAAWLLIDMTMTCCHKAVACRPMRQLGQCRVPFSGYEMGKLHHVEVPLAGVNAGVLHISLFLSDNDRMSQHELLKMVQMQSMPLDRGMLEVCLVLSQTAVKQTALQAFH